jgi:uncharacterized membrane protein YbhN (UPF0104 family)
MFMLTPMTLAAGAIPGTPGGLGIAEAAAGRLFAGAGYRQGDGVLVAMTYRVMTYVMVAVGAVYYLRARRAISDTMHEAEELADNESSGAATAS